jgi:hypothetical protein
VISTFLGEAQSTEINSALIKMIFKKSNTTELANEIKSHDSLIKIDSICEILNYASEECSNKVIVQQVNKCLKINNRLKQN